MAVSGCVAAPEGDAESGAAAATSSAGILDVGIESSKSEEVLTMGRISARNMLTLAELSNAAYLEGAALHDALCDVGLHPRGTARCATRDAPAEAELVELDTQGDDRAIYVRAALPSRDGPRDVGILAFRGTASRSNVVTDARATLIDAWGRTSADSALVRKDLPGAAHRGFDEAASRLWRGDAADKSLAALLRERHRGPNAAPLYVTGHSLGAAIATVIVGYALFGECTSIDAAEKFSTPRAAPAGELAWSLPTTRCPRTSDIRIEALYTYGSPRVGDPRFAEALANMMALRRVAHFRVVNANDVVARIAPRFSGYSHLHLDIQGLSETDGAVTRRFALKEDEHADAVWGTTMAGRTRIKKCRQWEDATDNPESCPTRSLAYLLPGPVDRDRTDILRLGEGATSALDDNRTLIPRVGDHMLGQYVPLLRKLVD